MKNIKNKIKELAKEYANRLDKRVDERIEEMNDDDKSHYLIYRVLNISYDEGEKIDVYQNKGRFLYRYAGSFLEEVTLLCFKHKYGEDTPTHVRIPNTINTKPKTFEIDCLIGNKAYEIKWRDATTDGDHITKEHTRIQVIKEAGYTPIRVMFYYPNRNQAIRIQQTLETLYGGVSGHYYYGDNAWNYIREKTEVDLKGILEEIAKENMEKENK